MGRGTTPDPGRGEKTRSTGVGRAGLGIPRGPLAGALSVFSGPANLENPSHLPGPAERLGRSRGHGKHLEAQLSPPGGQEQHRGPLPQLTGPPVPHPRKSGSQASGPRVHAGKGTHARARAHTHTHTLKHPFGPALTFCMPHSVPSRRGTRRRLQLLWSRGSVWQDRAWHMSYEGRQAPGAGSPQPVGSASSLNCTPTPQDPPTHMLFRGRGW